MAVTSLLVRTCIDMTDQQFNEIVDRLFVECQHSRMKGGWNE